jgi:predicted nucleotide-binding protein (sugar kinase/HSP70/actin superfamily)
MITAKHLATFMLGAAAGAAMMKYNNMSEEEREKVINDLKAKGETMKTEAEKAFATAQDYFEKLRTHGTEVLNTNMAEAEKMAQELLDKINQKTDTKTA